MKSENKYREGGPIDSYRAKLIAYAIVAVFIGIMAVMGVRSVSGPQLFEGDTVETRACRWCNGSGQDEETHGACPGCRGAKKLQVIVPGPKHPVTIRGTVREAGAFKDADDAMLQEVTEQGKPLQPVQGAVKGAHLIFDGPHHLEIDNKMTGRFHCVLEPGNYKLTVKADGFQDAHVDLVVPPATQPIWQEKAHLKTPERDADTVLVPVLLNR